ncbi:hypothetical protein LX36DRAFT_224623 [Colletotrichum falcatum]|nr:hypothetical protein LX36DRAFT_224623 [Colletotrichum falcatum]
MVASTSNHPKQPISTLGAGLGRGSTNRLAGLQHDMASTYYNGAYLTRSSRSHSDTTLPSLPGHRHLPSSSTRDRTNFLWVTKLPSWHCLVYRHPISSIT